MIQKRDSHFSPWVCHRLVFFFLLPAGASSSASPPLWFPPLFQIHIIDFDDENNIINKTVLLHQAGEIWHIGASPADKAVLTTCYNKSESHCFLLSLTPLASSLGVMLLYFAPLFLHCFCPPSPSAPPPAPPTPTPPAPSCHLHLIIQFAFSLISLQRCDQ